MHGACAHGLERSRPDLPVDGQRRRCEAAGRCACQGQPDAQATPEACGLLRLSFVIMKGVASRRGAARVPWRDYLDWAACVLGGCRHCTGLHKVVAADRGRFRQDRH